MIVTENYTDNNRFSFNQLSINTDARMVDVFYDTQTKIISFVEIYSAIKQMYIKHDKLLMHPFPMDFLTESSVTLINDYGLTII